MDTREWEKRARELAECQDVMPKSLEELQTRVYGAAMDMADTADEKICELLEARTREVVARMDHITTHVPFELDGSGKSISTMLYNLKLEGEATLKHFGIK